MCPHGNSTYCLWCFYNCCVATPYCATIFLSLIFMLVSLLQFHLTTTAPTAVSLCCYILLMVLKLVLCCCCCSFFLACFGNTNADAVVTVASSTILDVPGLAASTTTAKCCRQVTKSNVSFNKKKKNAKKPNTLLVPSAYPCIRLCASQMQLFPLMGQGWCLPRLDTWLFDVFRGWVGK